MSRIINSRNDFVLVDQLETAKSFLARAVGLIGRKSLAHGHGLLLKASGNSIHTCFMKFAIDVAFINREGEVKHIVGHIKPWRFVFAPIWGLTDCLELPAGTLEKTDTRIGDLLRVEN